MERDMEGKCPLLGTGEKSQLCNNAKVVKTDIVSKNGVIHVIDSVILPK